MYKVDFIIEKTGFPTQYHFLANDVVVGGWGCATGTLKPFLQYQRHMPIQLIWEYDPRALKCFAFTSLDQQALFNVTSNALFCVLQVWQVFIHFVLQRLLSRGANFHSSKHQKLYTRHICQFEI